MMESVSTSTNQLQAATQSVKEILEKQAKLNLGLHASAVQSIHRNLTTEDEAVRRDMLGEKGDDVGDIYLGDVNINQPAESIQQSLSQQPQQSATESKQNSWLIPAALTGLSLLSGGLGGLELYRQFFPANPTIIEQPDLNLPSLEFGNPKTQPPITGGVEL